MPQYTVRDESTGRVITFDWHGDGEPSDADLAEVFAAAGDDDAPSPPRDGFQGGVLRARTGRAPAYRPIEDTAGALPLVGGFVGSVAGPVGAALGGGAGAAARNVIRRRPVGEGVATEAALQGLAGPVARGAGRVLQAGARRAYQAALKPTKAVLGKMTGGNDAEKMAGLIRTGLDEGINVSRGGFNKATAAIDTLNDDIASAIQSSTATVPKGRVMEELARPVSQFRDQVAPLSDLRHIASVGREFNHLQPSHIPVQRAQALKQGTYRALRGKFGEVKSAEAEAQKALARGLKHEIASAVPAVAPMNARESALLSLREAVTDALRRTGNRDTVGLTDVVAAGTKPGLVGLTLMQRALPASAAARVMHRTGRTVEQGEPVARLLAALLSGGDQ